MAERLRYRVLADKSDPTAFAAPMAGSPAGTWPVLDAVVTVSPKKAQISMQQVLDGLDRGYITATGHRVETRGAGPAGRRWMTSPAAPQPHTFHQFDTITIGKASPVTYRVVHNPDKYVRGEKPTDKVTDEIYDSGQTEVVWHYDLELEGG